MTETSLRTTFRRALQVALGKFFEDAGLEISFVAGPIEGPQPDREIGCVWFDRKRPSSRDFNNEECFFGVRVFRRFRQEQGSDSTRDATEAELERTVELLEDALVANIHVGLLQTNSGADLAGWESYFNVVEVVSNHAGQYVQASLVAYARNRSARGG